MHSAGLSGGGYAAVTPTGQPPQFAIALHPSDAIIRRMSSNNAPPVTIYTDGAASPNPGQGGYGVVILQEGRRQELSGGFRKTTNNRMEIMGALVGLRSLGEQRRSVTLYSDSKYLVDMFSGGHALKWRTEGWTRNKGKEKALNPDLWSELLARSEVHRVEMVWVRGHDSNVENARCDELAVLARQANGLPPDTGYEIPVAADAPEARQLTLFAQLG